ncbi:MAG: hypothetical protein MJD61_04150 [Proteobacteria bacterium]|nr:hypothetical protein [Pseudomonadota bacterium]
MLIVVWRTVASRAKARQIEERWELAHPEYTVAEVDLLSQSFRLDFGEMTGKFIHSSDTERIEQSFSIRRVDVSKWESKNTLETHEGVAERIARDIEQVKSGKWSLGNPERRLADLEAELKELEAGPKWEPFTNELSARIEGDYQRFLHHQ